MDANEYQKLAMDYIEKDYVENYFRSASESK